MWSLPNCVAPEYATRYRGTAVDDFTGSAQGCTVSHSASRARQIPQFKPNPPSPRAKQFYVYTILGALHENATGSVPTYDPTNPNSVFGMIHLPLLVRWGGRPAAFPQAHALVSATPLRAAGTCCLVSGMSVRRAPCDGAFFFPVFLNTIYYLRPSVLSPTH